jgi:glycosyltransferase involved in cell wall biosynthesis
VNKAKALHPAERLSSSHAVPATVRVAGKRAAMVVFSYYSTDPRPRRAAEALVKEGMSVEVICLAEGGPEAKRQTLNGVDLVRVPVKRRRTGILAYVFQYVAFIVISFTVLAVRSFTRRYHLVYVHNMPDILVLSSLVPRALGAKVILDLHDPMPELLMTIFNLDQDRLWVRLLTRLEKWSIGRADLALTVNLACKRLFASRSCRSEKIGIVMNSPDEAIFRFCPPRADDATWCSPRRRFVIMYHGALVERNGLDLAVEAFARVRKFTPPVELRIYGHETPFLHRVMRSVRGKSLRDAVQFLGPKRAEDIAQAIEECDVGIIPNHRNLFTELNTPVRIFEYLALGRPVIAPRARGIQDYFKDGSLIFFELGDAADLARKIEYVFLHPGDVAEIVKRGQEVYLAHAWAQEKQTLVNLTGELLSRAV